MNTKMTGEFPLLSAGNTAMSDGRERSISENYATRGGAVSKNDKPESSRLYAQKIKKALSNKMDIQTGSGSRMPGASPCTGRKSGRLPDGKKQNAGS